MSLKDIAMVGAVGIAAADTILQALDSSVTRQPKAEYTPDGAYLADDLTTKVQMFDKGYTRLEDKLFVEKPLISSVNAYTHWSVLKINGIDCPGAAKIDVNFSKDINKTKLPGYDYCDVLDNGANLKQISVTIRMNAFDYATYKATIQDHLVVKTGNTGGLTAGGSGLLDPPLENIIYLENQLLADYGVSRAVLESISQSTPEINMTEIRLEFVEYVEKAKRPARATSGPAKKKTPTDIRQSKTALVTSGDAPYAP